MPFGWNEGNTFPIQLHDALTIQHTFYVCNASINASITMIATKSIIYASRLMQTISLKQTHMYTFCQVDQSKT